MLILVAAFEYKIYLHNGTLSTNEEKREKADLVVQAAISWVKADVDAYGRGSGLRTWRVLIV